MSEHSTVDKPVSSPRRPDPAVDRDNAFFWEAAKRGEFVSRSCDGCGHMVHPPVPMCPECHGLTWSERKLSGKGTVINWMKVHYPPTPLFDYPLLVVTIRLDEGIEMASNLVDLGDAEVASGLPVEVTFAETRGGWQVPIFKPARG